MHNADDLPESPSCRAISKWNLSFENLSGTAEMLRPSAIFIGRMEMKGLFVETTRWVSRFIMRTAESALLTRFFVDKHRIPQIFPKFCLQNHNDPLDSQSLRPKLRISVASAVLTDKTIISRLNADSCT